MKRNILLVLVFIYSLLVFSSTVFSVSPPNANSTLTVHFIDVGQGDSSFVMLPDGDNVLIDVGSPAAGPKLVSYLKSLGIDKINHLILTHPHDDHIGGIFSVLSEFEVDNFYDNGFNNFKSTIFSDYIRRVRNDLSRYKLLQAGESFNFENIIIDVLNPLLPPTGNLNDDSVVLRLICNDVKILFSGDIGNVGERRLLKIKSNFESQILKVGHHGENNTASDAFLEYVKPETAIISVGLINRFAQPHQELLNRLSQRNTRMYRTDLVGNIVLKTNGTTYSVSSEK